MNLPSHSATWPTPNADLGNLDKHKEFLKRALVIMETHYVQDHPQVAAAFDCLANALSSLADGDAHKQKRSCWSVPCPSWRNTTGGITTKSVGQVDENHADMILVNLANAHGDLGDPQKQKDLLDRALAIRNGLKPE